MSRNAAQPRLMPPHAHRRATGRVLSEGPNMIVLLFAMALVVGLLVGLGARQLTHRYSTNRQTTGELPAAAVDLGYREARDYRIDTERASLALSDVLAAEAGSQRLWENAETGNRGIVWASEETRRTDGASCRALARRTLINGAFRHGAGVACRTASGGWDQKGGWHAE